MPAAVLTPFTWSPAKRAGERKWRKRLLPADTIDYEGRQLRFDHGYLTELANAFNKRAYDYVPFQLAGDDNKHTNAVDKYAGRVERMEVEPDGLYIVLSATERGERVLADNPGLGVSARIVEDYARADGQYFPRAVQHVLATHDPRIPGLGGWQAIEASNDVQIVFDLSGTHFTGDTEGTGTMPELTAEQQARLAKLLEIPEDVWQQVVAGLTAPSLSPDELALLGEGTEGTAGEGEMSDAELDELVRAAEEMDARGLLSDAGAEPAAAGAALSGDALLALELTNARADETAAQLAQVTAHLDSERFLAEQRRLAQEFGIPPRVTELAKPLLLGAGHVVELSNGQAVDAGRIMRDVLAEIGRLGQATGNPLLDLSTELGSPIDEPDQHGQGEQDRAATVARFKAQTGIG